MPPSWVDINVVDPGRAVTQMEAYLTRPEGNERLPAVIVIQEIWGVNSHIQFVTDRLPSQGYVGLAPALFHREGRGTIGLHEEMETALGLEATGMLQVSAKTGAGIEAVIDRVIDTIPPPSGDPDGPTRALIFDATNSYSTALVAFMVLPILSVAAAVMAVPPSRNRVVGEIGPAIRG